MAKFDPNLTKVSYTPEGGSAIDFCLKSFKPPGVTSAEKVDGTSSCSPVDAQGNVLKEYLDPKFKEYSDASFSALFDPSEFSTIDDAIPSSGVFVITYGDTSTHTFNGKLLTFEPDDASTVENAEAWTASGTMAVDTKPVYVPAT